MVERRRIIATVIAALAVTVVVHADLMPVSSLQSAASLAPIPDSNPQEKPLVEVSIALAGLSGIEDIGAIPSSSQTSPQEGHKEPVVRPLVDRSNSFDLCLYALIGVGLCRSGQLVKRPSLGFVPEWYHSGGPRQIGHSYAIGPDSACPAMVCFVQPHLGAEDSIPQYDVGTIASLARKSQYTPDALASRGPPSMS